MATVRDMVGNKKIILRPINSKHKINLHELTELTTEIRNIEDYQNGSMGKAEYQYIKSVSRHDGVVNEDFISLVTYEN